MQANHELWGLIFFSSTTSDLPHYYPNFDAVTNKGDVNMASMLGQLAQPLDHIEQG